MRYETYISGILWFIHIPTSEHFPQSSIEQAFLGGSFGVWVFFFCLKKEKEIKKNKYQEPFKNSVTFEVIH